MSIASEIAEAITARAYFVVKDTNGHMMIAFRPAFRGWSITRDALNSPIPLNAVCESLRVHEGEARSAVICIGYGGDASQEQTVPSDWTVEVFA